MAWVKEEVYVITAFFKDDCHSEPSEEFFAITYGEAEKKQAELLEDDEYEDVLISDEMQEREFWYTKEELAKIKYRSEGAAGKLYGYENEPVPICRDLNCDIGQGQNIRRNRMRR